MVQTRSSRAKGGERDNVHRIAGTGADEGKEQKKRRRGKNNEDNEETGDAKVNCTEASRSRAGFKGHSEKMIIGPDYSERGSAELSQSSQSFRPRNSHSNDQILSACTATPKNLPLSRTNSPYSSLTSPIRQNIHSLLLATRPHSTICPSLVPRTLHSTDPTLYSDWRELMDPVRKEVWELVKEGKVEVTQRGKVKEYEERDELRGPIRVRKGRKWEEWDGK